jgi:hypothetical protein
VLDSVRARIPPKWILREEAALGCIAQEVVEEAPAGAGLNRGFNPRTGESVSRVEGRMKSRRTARSARRDELGSLRREK